MGRWGKARTVAQSFQDVTSILADSVSANNVEILRSSSSYLHFRGYGTAYGPEREKKGSPVRIGLKEGEGLLLGAHKL